MSADTRNGVVADGVAHAAQAVHAGSRDDAHAAQAQAQVQTPGADDAGVSGTTTGAGDEGDVSLQRRVLRLAWPSIVENLLQSVLGIVTVLMVARLGSSEVAAVGASQQIQMLFISAFFSLSMGATVLVAHAFGAQQHDRINQAARQASVATFALSIVIAVVVFVLSEPLLRLMGADEDVVALGVHFQQISALGYVFMALMFMLGGALRGVGDTRTPMLVTLGINVINVAVALPLIFGFGPIAGQELAGAAWAQNISRFIGFVWIGYLLWRGKGGITIAGRTGWRPDWSFMRRLADISLPAMGESLLRAGGQFLFVVIVFQLGTTDAAAHNIAQQAFFLSMFPGFGFSMAATALVGQSLGAGNPERARASTMIAMRWCIIWMSVMGVAFFVFGPQIMEFSAPDDADRAAIISHGADALKVIAFAQPLQAIGFVLAGALRGAGDTRFPMISTGLAMWIFRLPLAWVFAIGLDLGLPGVYLAMVFDNVILMGLNIWRYRQGKWLVSRLATPHRGAAPPMATARR